MTPCPQRNLGDCMYAVSLMIGSTALFGAKCTATQHLPFSWNSHVALRCTSHCYFTIIKFLVSIMSMALCVHGFQPVFFLLFGRTLEFTQYHIACTAFRQGSSKSFLRYAFFALAVLVTFRFTIQSRYGTSEVESSRDCRFSRR